MVNSRAPLGVSSITIGRTPIGFGASASPQALAAGRAYGSIPRSTAAGTLTSTSRGSLTTGSYRKILSPWGNNVPQRTGLGSKISSVRTGGRSSPSPSAELFGINYPPNSPAMWPIEGSKNFQFDLSGKATRHNQHVNNAYLRGTGLS